MEDNTRWALITAIAPIAWGSNYYVTHAFLPADRPLWGAALRALPAGLLLLALRRRRPQGQWRLRSAVLGVLNVGAFFVLIYVAAQRLPTSIAATVMAVAPVMMMLLAWLLVDTRPRVAQLSGGLTGLAGVGLMLFAGAEQVDPVGVAASAGAMVMSSLGFVLSQRWGATADVLALTSWQLLAGGLLLLPVAIVVEGAPPELDGTAVAAFVFVTVVATAAAFAAWFTGLRHLSAGTVGLIGLLNPVTGVLLGTVIAGELLGPRQLGGLALVLLGILLGQPGATRWITRVLTLRGHLATTVVQAAGTPAGPCR